MTNRILMAEIAAAHGIKGLVKIAYFGENIGDLEGYNPYFTSENGRETLTLTYKNPIKGGVLVSVEGVHDRNTAEDLRGQKLYIDKDRLAAPAEGEYYHADLVECIAIEDGVEIGRVIAVENFGAGDLLDIQPAAGGNCFYLPFKGEFVGEVDIRARKIEVFIPEGLRE